MTLNIQIADNSRKCNVSSNLEVKMLIIFDRRVTLGEIRKTKFGWCCEDSLKNLMWYVSSNIVFNKLM